MDPYPRRKSHKKRTSNLRLSSDSVPPLPVYSSPSWNKQELHSQDSDRPPDYPDTSDADADADADESDQEIQSHVPLLSPRRSRIVRHNSARTAQRHHQSSTDLYLDSLLARSVHALEISNNLLQSSMSNQSSGLSTLLSSESTGDISLEDKARDLSARIKRNRALQKDWMHDINEIGKRLDGLYDGEDTGGGSDDSVSKSLPTSGLAPLSERNHRRRPSLHVLPPEGHLDYCNHDRSHFISPAPRAMTVYIDSSDVPDDPNAIKLPSTLGHRSSPSTSSLPLSLPQSSRRTTFSGLEQPSKAYDILSTFAAPHRQPPRITSSSSTPTHSRSSSIRRGSPITVIERRRSSSTASRVSDPSDRTSPCKTPRGRSLTPLRVEPPSPPPNLPRLMTPPIEELSSNSSSSEPQFAVKSLRKILDVHTEAEQIKLARSASKTSLTPSTPSAAHPPSLIIRTSSTPIASTSHATASISRLLTKCTHSSSTRPGSPPRHSSLRLPSAPTSPAPSRSPSLLNISGIFGSASSSVGSGRSTPSRVTFAQLPESYGGSKPDGPSMRSSSRRRSRDGKKGKGKAWSQKDSDEEDLGWWMTWLFGTSITGGKHEERVEERVGARWGARAPGAGGMEDWTF